MPDYEILRFIWWALLGVLLIGFALTDGYDLGMGILLRFIAKTDSERRQAIATVEPVWEGNQVWFILGGGAAFAAWPMLYAASFSGFYVAMLVVLAALILRPVAFTFRDKLTDAALAQCLGLGAFHQRLRAGAHLWRRLRQSAAWRSLPSRSRFTPGL